MTTTKIAVLKDLTDPDKIETFERDMKNLLRKVTVYSLEKVSTTNVVTEDVTAEGATASAEKTTVTESTSKKQVDRGRLNLLFKYRVYPAKGGSPRDGTEVVQAGANHGGEWSEEITEEAEESAWAEISPYLGPVLAKRMSKIFDKPDESPDATGMMRYIIAAKHATDARTTKRNALGAYDAHVEDTMPSECTKEELNIWCDKLEELSIAPHSYNKDDAQLIEDTIKG